MSYFWKLAGRAEGDEPLYYRESFMADQWTINLDDPERGSPGRDRRAEDDAPQLLARSNAFMNSTSAFTPAARHRIVDARAHAAGRRGGP